MKSNREKNLMFLTVLAFACFCGTFAESIDVTDEEWNGNFWEPNSIPTTTTTTTTRATTTSTTETTTTTRSTKRTTTAKPVTKTKRCGLLNDRICVNRVECRTTTGNTLKLVIDLEKPSLSGCHYLETCCHPNDRVSAPYLQMESSYEQCGDSNVGGLFMAVKNGEGESHFAEFPWTVAILKENEEFICSGALISDKVILTTATCIAPEQPLIVRAGEWDLRTDNELVPHKTRTVDKRIIHQGFSWETTDSNIGMLILKEALPSLRHIAPVCLDNGGTDIDFDNCYISGWHLRRSNRFPKREIALKIKMDLTKSSDYSAGGHILGHIQTGRPVELMGAPLVCPTEDNRYHLVGAWSYSMDGTFFTDVRQYSEWIRDQLKGHNIEIEGL